MHEPTQPLPEVPLSQQETVDLPLNEHAFKQSRWRWIIDRNPLFLMSGVFMLLGCLLASNAIHSYDPAEVGEQTVLLLLVALLVILNVYEIAVIWLGLRLSKTKALIRDTRHLLGLALLLIIDAAFVYNETSIFSPWIGGLIAFTAAMLAVLKAGWIVRSLGIRPTPSACISIGVTLMTMYTLPVFVRMLASDGFLSQPQAMLIWSLLGGIIAGYAIPLKWFSFVSHDNPDRRQLQRLVTAGLIVLPLISLIGHACALLWVYEKAFDLSMVAPILLGLAAIILRQQERLGGPAASAKAAAILVGCAIIPCLMTADELLLENTTHTWLALSPLRGVLLTSPALLAWGWWINQRSILGAIFSALPIPVAALGHTPSAMLSHAGWLITWITRLLPRTQLQWGALAITSAFICLAIGSLISWRLATKNSRSHGVN